MVLKLPIPKFSEWTRPQRLLAFGGMLLWSVVMLDRFVLKPWGDHAAHVRKEIARLEEAGNIQVRNPVLGPAAGQPPSDEAFCHGLSRRSLGPGIRKAI